METPGTRVESVADVWDGEPGCYFVKLTEEGEVSCLWFQLPTGSIGRIAAKGHGTGDEPEWDITVDDDGVPTVDPSIEQHKVPGVNIEYWHGHFVGGVWRD